MSVFPGDTIMSQVSFSSADRQAEIAEIFTSSPKVLKYEMEEARDEKEIISRILGGEREAYRLLVTAHEKKLICCIMRRGAGEDLARELAQETFLRAYLKLSSFRFEASFGTWLTRIAINITNSYFSSRAFKQSARTVLFDAAKHELPGDEQTEPGEKELSRLRAAISLLPPLYREVLVLCGVERKSYEEAAELLAIPLGTVRSRLNKARLLLRRLYFETEIQ